MGSEILQWKFCEKMNAVLRGNFIALNEFVKDKKSYKQTN